MLKLTPQIRCFFNDDWENSPTAPIKGQKSLPPPKAKTFFSNCAYYTGHFFDFFRLIYEFLAPKITKHTIFSSNCAYNRGYHLPTLTPKVQIKTFKKLTPGKRGYCRCNLIKNFSLGGGAVWVKTLPYPESGIFGQIAPKISAFSKG